jgi:hypothetical protein
MMLNAHSFAFEPQTHVVNVDPREWGLIAQVVNVARAGGDRIRFGDELTVRGDRRVV